jgi:hypothetical protein
LPFQGATVGGIVEFLEGPEGFIALPRRQQLDVDPVALAGEAVHQGLTIVFKDDGVRDHQQGLAGLHQGAIALA